jgi:hypothetical protein
MENVPCMEHVRHFIVERWLAARLRLLNTGRVSGVLSWLHWSAIRAPILPIAWVLAHTTVLLWKALDPRYIDSAQWLADRVLMPLHPLGVWLIGVIAPPLRTLVSNMPPTHLDADKILYGFLVPIFVGLILGIGGFFREILFGRKTAHSVPSEAVNS